MQLNYKTQVKGSYKEVFDAFNESLFIYLLPIGAELLRFDGSNPEDLVQIRFPLGIEWMSKITFRKYSPKYCVFVDEGIKLPFGLKHWKHSHIVHKDGTNAIIEDDIQFSTKSQWLDKLLFPVLYAAFYPRKRLYKKYFQKKFDKTL